MLLVNPCLGDKLLYGATDQVLESYVPPEEERVQPVQWVTATSEEHSRGIRLTVQHSKVGMGQCWGMVWGRPADGLGEGTCGNQQGQVDGIGLGRGVGSLLSNSAHSVVL